MADAEELRQLTLAAKAKNFVASTQSNDLDQNVLKGKTAWGQLFTIIPSCGFLIVSPVPYVSYSSFSKNNVAVDETHCSGSTGYLANGYDRTSSRHYFYLNRASWRELLQRNMAHQHYSKGRRKVLLHEGSCGSLVVRSQPLTLILSKTHEGDLGRRSLLGSFESEKLFHEYEPQHVPRPIAFGNYKSNPNVCFFLAEFHDMVETLPDVVEFVSIVAGYHKKSSGKSPNGKWGFHTETGLPFVQHDNEYQDTWEALFTNMMRKMLEAEERVHGPNEELQKLKDDLFEKVIPRLLRPMETAGRSISPCLIHTDLWPGNILPDVNTGRLMIYDSRAMWGHNECDLGTWRAARFRLGTPYITEYRARIKPSEPQEDWGDRHLLYEL